MSQIHAMGRCSLNIAHDSRNLFEQPRNAPSSATAANRSAANGRKVIQKTERYNTQKTAYTGRKLEPFHRYHSERTKMYSVARSAAHSFFFQKKCVYHRSVSFFCQERGFLRYRDLPGVPDTFNFSEIVRLPSLRFIL